MKSNAEPTLNDLWERIYDDELASIQAKHARSPLRMDALVGVLYDALPNAVGTVIGGLTLLALAAPFGLVRGTAAVILGVWLVIVAAATVLGLAYRTSDRRQRFLANREAEEQVELARIDSDHRRELANAYETRRREDLRGGKVERW